MKNDDNKKSPLPGTSFTVEVRPHLPQRFERLDELANDLYYSWNRGVRGLLRHIDQDCWNACGHNPRVFMRRMRQQKLDAAARDPILVSEYRHVLATYDTYHEEPPNARLDASLDRIRDLVAYFSAEFGFHESVPIYAGGLGILAADYCKAMSNLWVPFVGVGLLYRQGYFSQRIDCNGLQIATYPVSDPCDLPVRPALDAAGNELLVHVELPGRSLELKVWLVKVGMIRLYLLDSDVPANSPQDRQITAQLYGGDGGMRLHQEIVLGIGGVRALRALGLHPTVWHINEGHAAFLILERCREYRSRALDLDTALELVASNTAFTTHTPVPAGHDVYSFHDIRHTLGQLLGELDDTPGRVLELGSVPGMNESFSMTSLALRGARYLNGVSRIHGGVAAEMSAYVWPEIVPEENPMGYVTNGADVDTYLALPWVSLFEMYMGGGWRAKLSEKEFWRGFIDRIQDHVFLSVRQILKVNMLEEVGRRALEQYERCPSTRSLSGRLTRFLTHHSKDVLTIGFARRFATYKRATLLFRDLARLERLVNDPERPVMFVFAGKAHPNDVPGQKLLKQVYDVSMRPEFQGRITFLEDYNLSMARDLLPGVDVWLNNPEYPLEACGTSGMKAAINGVINLSVLDGWWDEAYDGSNGWAITPYPELGHDERERQEAEDLLNILEHQVIPVYYNRNSEGEPEAWVAMAKSSMKTVLPAFNTIRMAEDYLRDLYCPAAAGCRRLHDNDAAGARELALWKRKVMAGWPGLRARIASPVAPAIGSGETLSLAVEVELNGLQPSDIRVECIVIRQSDPRMVGEAHHIPFRQVDMAAEGTASYHCDLFESDELCSSGGLHYYKVRVYPWHALLSHPFECGRMRWL